MSVGDAGNSGGEDPAVGAGEGGEDGLAKAAGDGPAEGDSPAEGAADVHGTGTETEGGAWDMQGAV